MVDEPAPVSAPVTGEVPQSDRALSLTWLTYVDSGSPMGLQTYETSVMSALSALEQDRWRFRRRTVASLRSTQRADRRVPMGALAAAPSPAARALGRWVGRGGDRTHRFDLRLPPAGAGEVVTVHDLPPLRFPDEGHLPPWSASSARRARAVICPSEFAAQEVHELLGVRQTVVIPNGVDADKGHDLPLSAGDREVLGLSGRMYVLHAGGATARKNLAALAAAWQRAAPLVPDHELVLAGPSDPRRDRAFAGLERVRLLGFQPRQRIRQLMVGASCVVVPSIYEGFGLPALEAMSAGTPVLVSRRGALPEVCGDAALLCEPNGDDLAQALVSLLADESLQDQLRRRGATRAEHFTWERSARLHLEAYDRYL